MTIIRLDIPPADYVKGEYSVVSGPPSPLVTHYYTRKAVRSAFVLGVVVGAILCFTAITATAGDSVGSALWPPEPQYKSFVEEVTCMQLQDCCDVWGPCWNGWDKSIPLPVTTAPVPVPAPIYPLASAMVLMCCLIWKGMRR